VPSEEESMKIRLTNMLRGKERKKKKRKNGYAKLNGGR